MIKLHNHQSKMVDEIRAALPEKRSVIAQAATGFGKSFLAVFIIAGAIAKNNRVIFCVHRKQLLDQTSAAFTKANVSHGFIAAGKPASDGLASIAMIQTLQKRMGKMEPPKLLVFDECHIAASKGADEIIKWVIAGGGMVIGLTATPQRTDGRGLGDQFNQIIEGPSMEWLIKNKFLSPYEIFAPDILPDMSEVATSKGDFDQNEAEKIINDKAITGNAVEQYRQYADGKACIVFANSVAHAYDVAAQFCEAGYKFVAIDANTPDEERRAAIDDLANRRIHGICNYGLCIEGLDIPLVECVIILRATKSLIVWLQAIGRGMRYILGKTCVIIDSTGNVFRAGLGLPCSPRQWMLESKRKKRATHEEPMALKHCKECKAIYSATLPCCPRCGAQAIIEHRPVNERKGKLAAVTKESVEAIEAARKLRKQEEWKAQTYRELVELGEKRGYANPKYWAKLKLELRGKKNGKSKTS